MSLQLGFLADHVDSLRRVATWYVNEWGHTDPSRTVEDTMQRLSGNLNRDCLPLSLVGLVDNKVVGTAELKFREMEQFPEHEHWLGGVYVDSNWRGRRYGANIVEGIASQARQHGVKTLWLQTERLDGGLYATLGWKPWREVNNHGIEVLVMQRQIGDP